MSNLGTPGANSSRDLGGIESGEPSDSTPNSLPVLELADLLEISGDDWSSFGSTFFASEDDLPIDFASSRPPEITRNDLKRKAPISNHKGVHFRKKNQKFVSRLCLPGGKSRKLELGEYNTHDEAVRAYQVGAFYYNKSSTSNCGEDHSFLETLPCVPDNLSDADKLAWVRERARHSAASIGTSERRGTCSSKRVLESGGSSFDARPGTPASYGTEGSCDDCHSTPTTPTTANGPCATGCKEMFNAWVDGPGEDQVDSLLRFPGDALNNRRKGQFAAPQRRNSELKWRNIVPVQSQGLPNVELQQGRNSTALTNQAPAVDHQGDSQVKFTDSILFALFELRKQGWEWTLKRRSPSSVETGVLFSVPRGQHVAPALRITDIITNSFHELREQGWEVHLQPHKGGDGKMVSEVCVSPTGCAAQDKMKASKFSARSLAIGSWLWWSAFHGAEVMVKFSYAKQKLVWEVQESGHEMKMEILWSQVDTMKATYSDFDSDILEINVSRPPSFFKRSTLRYVWVACTDFTNGQASMCMLHYLVFPRGVLKEHYEKLVQCDTRLKTAHTRAQEWSDQLYCSVFSPEENTDHEGSVGNS